ncbi:hypothetical protein ISCGN_031746 [Ixodes scapularis]
MSSLMPSPRVHQASVSRLVKTTIARNEHPPPLRNPGHAHDVVPDAVAAVCPGFLNGGGCSFRAIVVFAKRATDAWCTRGDGIRDDIRATDAWCTRGDGIRDDIRATDAWCTRGDGIRDDIRATDAWCTRGDGIRDDIVSVPGISQRRRMFVPRDLCPGFLNGGGCSFRAIVVFAKRATDAWCTRGDGIRDDIRATDAWCTRGDGIRDDIVSVPGISQRRRMFVPRDLCPGFLNGGGCSFRAIVAFAKRATDAWCTRGDGIRDDIRATDAWCTRGDGIRDDIVSVPGISQRRRMFVPRDLCPGFLNGGGCSFRAIVAFAKRATDAWCTRGDGIRDDIRATDAWCTRGDGIRDDIVSVPGISQRRRMFVPRDRGFR